MPTLPSGEMTTWKPAASDTWAEPWEASLQAARQIENNAVG